jgi:hypothetical protein
MAGIRWLSIGGAGGVGPGRGAGKSRAVERSGRPWQLICLFRLAGSSAPARVRVGFRGRRGGSRSRSCCRAGLPGGFAAIGVDLAVLRIFCGISADIITRKSDIMPRQGIITARQGAIAAHQGMGARWESVVLRRRGGGAGCQGGKIPRQGWIRAGGLMSPAAPRASPCFPCGPETGAGGGAVISPGRRGFRFVGRAMRGRCPTVQAE